jgi:signal transduction histidine kinase
LVISSIGHFPMSGPSLDDKLQRLALLEARFDEALEQAKLSAVKELAYGASHEINNPLANISTRAQALLAEEKHPERRKKLATIVAQAMRAHEMISDLMLFAKPPPMARTNCNLGELLGHVVSEAMPAAREQATELRLAVEPPDLSIHADPTHLAVAVGALVRNALEALGEGGEMEVTATQADDEVTLAVHDNGPGIEPHVREHLFDPFFSGREAGRGLGFGLAKCWRIIDLHGGRVEVESEPGEGTVLTIHLPLQPE